MEHWSFSDWVLFQIVPRIYSWVLRLLALTIRREVRHPEYPEEFWNQGKSLIVVFWHQRLLVEERLRQITAEADGYFQKPPVS
jgi:lysophospholipid acyltransferase (LPLAT)-like uncharacterized protein